MLNVNHPNLSPKKYKRRRVCSFSTMSSIIQSGAPSSWFPHVCCDTCTVASHSSWVVAGVYMSSVMLVGLVWRLRKSLCVVWMVNACRPFSWVKRFGVIGLVISNGVAECLEIRAVRLCAILFFFITCVYILVLK